MIISLFLLAAALFVFGVYMCQKGNDDGGIFAGTCAFLLAIVLMAATTVSVFMHADDVGTVREWHQVYHVYERQLSELKQRLDGVEMKVETDALLIANKDTPYASLISAYTRTQNKLAEVESKAAEASVSIAKRKAGPFWFVVSMYGEN